MRFSEKIARISYGICCTRIVFDNFSKISTIVFDAFSRQVCFFLFLNLKKGKNFFFIHQLDYKELKQKKVQLPRFAQKHA
jgi:hypothetical protein